MKFAVASEDIRSIANHAGRATRFMVFEAEKGSKPVEIGRIDLTEEQTVHNLQGGAHPLDGIEVLIAGSAGACFVEKMVARGITTVVVRGVTPEAAVAAYLEGLVGPLTEAGACGCNGDHH